MAYSFTALSQFEQCPKKYYETRVLKKWKQPESEEMQYGTKVHKALEDYALTQAPLPLSLSQYQPYADALDEARAAGMVIAPEQTIGVTYDGQGVKGRSDIWWADDVKLAGISDLTLLTSDLSYARIADYKTGSAKYPKMEQLDLMAYLTFVEYPTVQTIDAMLLFVKVKEVYPHQPERYTRDDMADIAQVFDQKIAQVEVAKATGQWADNGGNPLCGWCEVLDCPFHQEFKHLKERKRK